MSDALDVKGALQRHADLIRGDRRRQQRLALLAVLLVAPAIFAFWRLEFSFARLGSGLGQLAQFLGMMIPPDPGPKPMALVHAMAETLAIALIGTLAAAALALPFSLLAARNVNSFWPLRFLTRRASDTVRGVDTLIWALIWISVVGLGPFAGVLAIMTSDFATLTKLFSEAIETVDKKAEEGVIASGGSKLAAIRLALLPQAGPVLISQVLYFFESNTRSATIIGIVGAGGIGMPLTEMVRTYEWGQVAFILVMILAAVAVIDVISTRLRTAIIGTRKADL